MFRNVTLLLAVLLLGACSGSSTRPTIPPAELKPFTPELEVSSRWTVQLGQGVGRHYLRMAPLVKGEQVYQANRGGAVAAFNEADGHRLWRVGLERPLSAGPGDGGDMLLLGGDAEVIALSSADGSEVWRSEVSSEVLSAPMRIAELVIVRTVDGGVTALQASNGSRLWHYQHPVPTLSLRGNSEPVIGSGLVVCGFANGKIVALDLASGQMRWQTTLAVPRGRTELERMADVDATLVLDRGVLYAASYQNRVAALLLANGRKLWEREIGAYSGMAMAGNTLFVSDKNSEIWALDRNSGGTLWKQGLVRGRSLGTPLIQGRYLMVGDFEGYLHWFAQEDGHIAGRSRVEDWEHYWPVEDPLTVSDYKEDRGVIGTPVVSGSNIYAMDKRGVLNVFQVKPLEAGE